MDSRVGSHLNVGAISCFDQCNHNGCSMTAFLAADRTISTAGISDPALLAGDVVSCAAEESNPAKPKKPALFMCGTADVRAATVMASMGLDVSLPRFLVGMLPPIVTGDTVAALPPVPVLPVAVVAPPTSPLSSALISSDLLSVASIALLQRSMGNF